MKGICAGCGRTTEKSFIFCPWCGNRLAETNSKEYLENISNLSKIMLHSKQEEEIESVGKQLDQLENELNVMVMCAALAR